MMLGLRRGAQAVRRPTPQGVRQRRPVTLPVHVTLTGVGGSCCCSRPTRVRCFCRTITYLLTYPLPSWEPAQSPVLAVSSIHAFSTASFVTFRGVAVR